MAKATNNYTAESIVILEGLEPVRMRPGMYVGDLERPHAKSQLLVSLLTRPATAALAGKRARARVRLFNDGTAIVDDDVGLPLELIENFFLRLHCNGPSSDPRIINYQFGPPSIATALSSTLEVELHHEGRICRQQFTRGKKSGPCDLRDGPDRRTAATYRITLDPTIFPNPRFDADDIKLSLQDILFFIPNLDLELSFDGHRAELTSTAALLTELTLRQRDFLDDVIARDVAAIEEPVEGTGTDMRGLALRLNMKSCRREEHCRVRCWVERAIEHLRQGRINAGIEDYRLQLARLLEEDVEHVTLLELIAIGAIEDVCASVERTLKELEIEALEDEAAYD